MLKRLNNQIIQYVFDERLSFIIYPDWMKFWNYFPLDNRLALNIKTWQIVAYYT